MARTEIADVLAFSNVQKAIGQMIEESARLSGINPQAGKRMAIGIVERIGGGEPVDSAIALVRSIQEASLSARLEGQIRQARQESASTPDDEKPKSVSPKQKSS